VSRYLLQKEVDRLKVEVAALEKALSLATRPLPLSKPTAAQASKWSDLRDRVIGKRAMAQARSNHSSVRILEWVLEEMEKLDTGGQP
jgi:hypothetical protein